MNIRTGLVALKNKIQKKEISCVETVRATLKSIEANKKLNAYITVMADSALEKAKDLDLKIKSGKDVGCLAGIPIAVKDNIAVRDVPNTCASGMLSGYRCNFDAEVVVKLRAADAIIIGKTNMDEFAMGTSNETSYYGPVLNPVNAERVPGGSSGGSACAVASCQCFGALGTDTGGSIRQPASHCGVVGLKPTNMSVSSKGVVRLATSLDQVGTITRSVSDTALLFQVIAGQKSYKLDRGIKDIRIGFCKEFFYKGLFKDIEKTIFDVFEIFKREGCTITDVSLPSFRAGLAAYSVLSYTEANYNLSRFDGIHYGRECIDCSLENKSVMSRTQNFGWEVKRRIMLGAFLSDTENYSRYYLQAGKVRRKIIEEFNEIFKLCDILICPTSLITAYKLGEDINNMPEVTYSDMYTVLANLTGIPSLTLPCGKDEKGLPIGVNLMGPKLEEKTIFEAAKILELNLKSKN